MRSSEPAAGTGAGYLIAFEGIEGAGKSTQLQQAESVLRSQGRSVLVTREPGGTPVGRELRKVLLQQCAQPPTARAELLLYLADRAQHVEEVIRPALTTGSVVLTDRFSGSTIAYQGYARGLDLPFLLELDAWARNDLAPALNVLLDCPPETGLRRAGEHDRFHAEDLPFHQRVREGFLAQAGQAPERWLVIDATCPADVVSAQVNDAIRRLLES